MEYERRTGPITRYHQYDGANRLIKTTLAAYNIADEPLPATDGHGVVIDQRYYDGNGRLVQSGPGDQMDADYKTALTSYEAEDAKRPKLSKAMVTTKHIFDENGNMLGERVDELNGDMRYLTNYIGGYDNEGHALRYNSQDKDGNITSVRVNQTQLDGYKQGSVTSTSVKANTDPDTGATTYGPPRTDTTVYVHDANNHLVRSDTIDATNAITSVGYVNDARGNVVYSITSEATNGSNQTVINTAMHRLVSGQQVYTTGTASTGPDADPTLWAANLTSFIVADPTVGSGGEGGGGGEGGMVIDDDLYAWGDNTQTNASVEAADATAQTKSGQLSTQAAQGQSGPTAGTPTDAPDVAGPRIHSFDDRGNPIIAVQEGETLRSLAQQAYGDSKYWYLIAEANGLSSDAEVTPGQWLIMPKDRVTSSEAWSLGAAGTDGYQEFTNYQFERVANDSAFWNTVPSEGGGWGVLGKIAMVVAAVVITYYLGPAAGAYFGSTFMGTAAAAAVTATAASIGSQAVGVITKQQEHISFEAAMTTGLVAGLTAGVGSVTMFDSSILNAAANGGINNAITQGVMIATDQQSNFDFTAMLVAGGSSGINAAVGSGITDSLSNSGLSPDTIKTMANVGGNIVSTAAVNNGNVDVGQIISNTLINTAGSMIAGEVVTGMGPTQGVGAYSGLDYVNEMDKGSDNYNPVFDNGYRNGSDIGSDNYVPGIQGDFRKSERDYRSTTETSVLGNTYLARSGDNISNILGTSNPQDVGNFMRANGLTSSTIMAGQNYFVPTDNVAYGDSSGLGQNTLNVDNATRAAVAQQRANEQRDMWDAMSFERGGPTGAGGPVWHVGGSGPSMVEQAVYTANGDYAGTEMVASSGSGPSMPYAQSVGNALDAAGRMGIGGLKGFVNGVPEMGVGAAKGWAYMGAGLRDGYDSIMGAPSSNYLGRAIAASESYSGEVISYDGDGFQRMGGFAGELASPAAYMKAGELGAAGLRALGPTFGAAAENYMYRTGGLMYAVPPEGAGASGATRTLSTEASNALQGEQLSQHLRQLQKYGEAGSVDLQNGAIRYYGEVTAARSPGEMVGARLVREWNPSTSATRTWYETLDGAGTVRSVAPKPVTGPLNHRIFDANGNYVGRR